MKYEHCMQDMNVIDLKMNEAHTECQQEFGCANQHCVRYIGNDSNNPRSITVKGPWIVL